MIHTREEQMEASAAFWTSSTSFGLNVRGTAADKRKSAPHTIEETYELCDALMRDDKKDICKELGDVLLHVAFYAKIGSEQETSTSKMSVTSCAQTDFPPSSRIRRSKS